MVVLVVVVMSGVMLAVVRYAGHGNSGDCGDVGNGGDEDELVVDSDVVLGIVCCNVIVVVMVVVGGGVVLSVAW